MWFWGSNSGPRAQAFTEGDIILTPEEHLNAIILDAWNKIQNMIQIFRKSIKEKMKARYSAKGAVSGEVWLANS